MVSKKRLLIGTGLAIVIIGAVAAVKSISSKLSAPAQGSISASTSRTPAQTGINLTPRPIAGKYASFSYPAGLSRVANNKIIAPVIAMYNFSYRDIESWNLAIDILLIPSGQLTDNNSYQVRKINPQDYQESHVVINHQAITVMTDKTAGGFSKVAFLVNGSYQATVSLYGDDANGVGGLQSTLNMVLGTWRWPAD